MAQRAAGLGGCRILVETSERRSPAAPKETSCRKGKEKEMEEGGMERRRYRRERVKIKSERAKKEAKTEKGNRKEEERRQND